MTEEGEGADPVGVMKSLLSMAIYNISYIRGVFHEKYFNDESVPELEMKFKMLMPMDDEARKLIDWMEKGVYDALHKKYLKTLLFSTYEEDGLMMEEYAWSNKGCIIKSNASDVTPHQMRSSACKMIRRLVSLMRTLDPMPDKQTIIMKMEYNEDITPIDYQSPFLKFCAYNDTINVWNENSLKMEMNDVSSKHLVLVLKVKKILEPCDNGNFSMSVDNESDYDCFSNTEPPQRRYGYVFASSSKKTEFVLDSGATHHVCNDKSIMRNMKDVKKDNQITLYSCGGRELKAEFMGSVVMKDFRLSQVGYIPNMAFNVVSVGQLASQGLLTQIVDSHFTITDVNDAMLVGEGFLQKRKDKANEREYIEYIFRTMNWDVPGDDEKLIDNSREDENQNDQEGEEWMIDTGCEMHMVPELGILRNPRPQKLSFQAASGTIQSTHKGSVKEGKLVLKDVLYCRDLRNKLISVGRLDLSGHRVTFSAGRCTIVHKDGLELQGVGVLDKITNMYLLLPEKEKNEAGTEAEKNPEEEDGKNGSFMAEEDNGMRNLKAQADVKNKRATAEEIQCRLTRDTKCTKNKKARGQDKGKAAKRQRHK